MTEENEILNREIYQALRDSNLEEADLLIDIYHIKTGLDKKEDESPLHEAARENAVDIIRKLLQDGADINIQNSIYETPLISAMISKADDAFAVLLELGADPNMPPRAGVDGGPTSPLMEAARRGNYRNMQMLLQAGARTEDWDWDGDTALDYALEDNDEKAAGIIRAHEMDAEILRKNRRFRKMKRRKGKPPIIPED